MRWDKVSEIKAIQRFGGTPSRSVGPDGTLNGKPVEVKSVYKDDRFRIGEKTHKLLMKKGGFYIFVDEYGNRKIVPASIVEKKMHGKWLKDRHYPHRFVNREQVFSRENQLKWLFQR